MAEFVTVQVPVERVQEVYELLGRPPARPSVVHQITEDGFSVGWTPALLDRMFVESSDSMRRILFSIARRSPDWVTTEEIASSSELTVRQVVAALGPFQKRVRGRYGMALWPFEVRDFVGEGVLKYSMPSGTAGRILALVAPEETHGSSSEEGLDRTREQARPER